MLDRSIALEVCIDRLSSALAAVRGGADRLEVCGALGSDGVTPSMGLLEQCVELPGVSRMAMVRPHEGGFCYDASDLQTMLKDIQKFKAAGAEGVVFGVLCEDGSVDCENCRRLIDEAQPMQVTFHRAFDITPDPLRALDALLELGCDRLLTSGQAALAIDGTPLIRELVARSADRMTIIAGTGISAANVQQLLEATGVGEIHLSGSVQEKLVGELVGGKEVAFGRHSQVTQEGKIRAVRQAIDSK